jgi:hypothetical protein
MDALNKNFSIGFKSPNEKKDKDIDENLSINQKRIEEQESSLSFAKEQIPNQYSFENISRMFQENNSFLEKIFENSVEESFSKENLNFTKFADNIVDYKNSASNFVNLKPQFSVYSILHQSLYILVSLKCNNNISDNSTDYFLYVFDKSKSFKKIKLKFNDINLSKGGFVTKNKKNKFLIDRIIIHQKNQNQLCFVFSNKVAFIDNLGKLNDTKSNSEIIIYPILDLTDNLSQQNFNQKDAQVSIGKFSFWDFDNHFGILTSDGILRIYYLITETDITNFSFKNLLSISLNEPSANIDKEKAMNILDFEFGRCNMASIWEAFSIFFLDASGKVFYCSPIFPEVINTDLIMPFTKMKRFLRIFSNLNRNEINSEKKNNRRNENLEKNREENIDKHDFDLANENIINNLIELEKSQTSDKNNDGRISIGKINLHDKRSHNPISTRTIIINDYLRAFNRQENIYLKEIVIIDRRRSSDIAKLNYDFLNSKLNENLKNDSYNIGNYIGIKIINSYPLTILRIYKNENIDIIIMFDQPKPIRNKNDKQKMDCYLIDTKIFKLTSKEQDQSDKNKSVDSQHLKNANSFEAFISHQNTHRNLFIIENPINSSQLMINFLSDVYILNLNFLKDLSNKFLFEKNKSKNPESSIKNFSLKVNSELIPILKINYSKIKDFTKKKFSFLGLSFLPCEFFEKSNSNKDNKVKMTNKVLIIGFNDKNNFFAKEYLCYENITEIFSDNLYLQNRNSDFRKFIVDKNQETEQNKDLEKFSFKIEDFRRSRLNKSRMEDINLVRKMYLNLSFINQI